MAKTTPYIIKNSLLSSINQLLNNKELYFDNPDKDFSRTQKISFLNTMLFPIIATGESTSVEMLDFFPQSKMPTQSALNYRRSKVNLAAFQDLFSSFTAKLDHSKSFHGRLLIACDGTRINTPFNPSDRDSFVNCIENRKGFNQYHLNSFYDILNDLFIDSVIQGYYSMDEKAALCQMADRFPKDKPAIFIADRGYASYNTIAHLINNGQSFVIRLTSTMAKNIFFDNDIPLDSPFDIEDVIHIGRNRTKAYMALRNYHPMLNDKTYDSIPVGSKKVDSFRLRLVGFELQGGQMEYLLTNLSATDFSLDDLKEIYRLRWGIETSFRHLKYSSGIIHIHSLKPHFIFQEIYAKLICYNFCSAIMKIFNFHEKGNGKHRYVIDKTYLFKTSIRYLKGKINAISKLIEKKKVPVRAGRKFERNIRRQHADTLQYR